MLGYTTRSNVEQFLNRTFPEVSTNEFNIYIGAAEKYVNNYTGYNASTTLSGMLSEAVVNEKARGKLDAQNNMVIDVAKPPIHFDANSNPIVTKITYTYGAVRIDLSLTDNSSNPLNTILEVEENRKKIYYPSIYYVPAIATVTPTAKLNLYNLKDTAFWTLISYVGGYDTLPEDVQLATNYIVADFLLHRDNPNFLSSYTQGSTSSSFAPSSESRKLKISEGLHIAQTLLQPYVRYVF